MPRLPVDGVKVIEHRITLGGKEREVLESAMTAYSFRNVADPVVKAINDNTTLLLLAALLGLTLPSVLPDDWPEITENMGYSDIKDWLEIQNLAGAFGGAAAGTAVAGPVGCIIGAILASMGVEIGEDLLSEGAEAAGTAGTAAVMLLSNLLNRVSSEVSQAGSNLVS